MEQQADLAFFQNFYTGVSLYVVAEAPTPVSSSVKLVPPVSASPAASPPPAPRATEAAPVAAQPVAPAPATALPPARLPAPAVPPGVLATLPAPVSTAPGPLPVLLTAPAVSPVANTPFSTLGSNAQGLVILVRLDSVRFQRLPKNVFLNNVLKAIRLIVEDVVIVNVESHLPVALSTLRQHLAARQIIGFGKNLLDVAVSTTQLYEPVLLAGDAAYLPAAEIDIIEEDTSRKKMLWQAMQRMFLS